MIKNKRKVSILLALIMITSFSFTSTSMANGVEADSKLEKDSFVENDNLEKEGQLAGYRVLKDAELRDGNGPNHQIIDLIPESTILEGLDSSENDFIEVEYNDKLGYIHRDYLEKISEKVVEAIDEDINDESDNTINSNQKSSINVSQSNGREYRSIKDLDLREFNSDESKSLKLMAKGSYVKHLGTTENDWFKVANDGRVGYVHRSQVTALANYEKNYKDIRVSKSNGREYRAIRDLELRERNTNESKSLKLMAKGSYVKHMGTTDNDWFKVANDGRVGYVHRSQVTALANYEKNYKDIRVSKSNGREYRTIRDLELRERNTNESKSLKLMAKGSYVKHLGTTDDDDWFKVESDGRIGYVDRTQVTSLANYEKNYDYKLIEVNGREYRTIKELHLRSGNSNNHQSLKLMDKGTYVKHLGTTNNDWFKVESNGSIGFVHRRDVTTPQNYERNYDQNHISIGTKYITTSSLNMRTGKSTNHRVITNMPKGAQVGVISTDRSGWSKIYYKGQEGYASSPYLKLAQPIIVSDKVSLKTSRTTIERQRLVNTALSLVDKVPYFWGGKSYASGWDSDWNVLKKVTSPGTSATGSYLPFGLDCSGFVKWAYNSAGMGRNFTGLGTYHQWIGSTEIRQENALPGDLVFKAAPGNGVNHIGIYVGQSSTGQALVVHSSYGRNGVVLTTLRNSGLKHFRRAKNTFR